MSFRTLQSRIDQAVSTLAEILPTRPLRLAVSGGKDSSVCVILAVRAVERLIAQGVRPMPLILTSSDTGVENPEVSHLLRSLHKSVIAHGKQVGFEVISRIVEPSLTEAWWPRLLAGRKLVSYIGTSGDCSVDMKISPQERLMREMKTLLDERGLPDPVTVIGSRRDESTRRAASMESRGTTASAVVDGVIAPIADWSTDDVMVTLIDRDIERFPHDYGAIVNFYGDSSSGECLVTPERRVGAASGGCSSRSGCYVCQKVGDDKSLRALVAHDAYEHLSPLLALNQYLRAIRWDLRRRNWIGRDIDPATGSVKLAPNCFSFEECDALLRMVLTLDRDEQRRADNLRAAIARGDVPDTPRNRRLADPQFCNVDFRSLIAIDFMRAVDCFGPSHSALAAWRDVYDLGKSYPVPSIQDVPRPASLPAPMYSQLRLLPAHGLFDPTLEATTEAPDLIGDGQFGDRLDIDATAAEEFSFWEMERFLDEAARDRSPSAAALRYLRLGIITVARGQEKALDWQMARSQAMFDAGLRPAPMLPISGAMSAEQHQAMVWDMALETGAVTSDEKRPTTAGGWQRLSARVADRRNPKPDPLHPALLAERVIGLQAALAVGITRFDGEDVASALRSAQVRLARAIDEPGRSVALGASWDRAKRFLANETDSRDDSPTALFPWIILGERAIDRVRPVAAGQMDLFADAA